VPFGLELLAAFASDFFSRISTTRAVFDVAFAGFCRVAIGWPLPQKVSGWMCKPYMFSYLTDVWQT
jgi:hypothetical protein